MIEFKKLLESIGFESYIDNGDFIYIFKNYNIEVYYENSRYIIMYTDNNMIGWENLGEINNAIKFIRQKFIYEMRKYKISLLTGFLSEADTEIVKFINRKLDTLIEITDDDYPNFIFLMEYRFDYPTIRFEHPRTCLFYLDKNNNNMINTICAVFLHGLYKLQISHYPDQKFKFNYPPNTPKDNKNVWSTDENMFELLKYLTIKKFTHLNIKEFFFSSIDYDAGFFYDYIDHNLMIENINKKERNYGRV